MARGGIFSLATASLLMATLLFALPARAGNETWRQDKPCGQRQAAMAPVEIKDCYRAWCSNTELGRLCACVKEDTDDTHFTLERSTGARDTWKAPFIPPLGGDADHFRIDRVGDGRLFLAAMSWQSVGIAISSWTLWAIDRERISKPLQVQNYVILSFPTTARSGVPCYLLVARWHSGSEPGRGPGTYIAGSWHAVEDGAFARLKNRPVIYTRYWSSVENARYEAESHDRLMLWYRHRSVRAVTGPSPLAGPLGR